ncbi:DUF6349 family protein [Mycetocola spongiae]|uniref:DUF6349 family protein n=1 Tax=Mycetocola spongiae TaxID=2859226 RepID=UPI001CF397FF|nr:DUF6349 family protein [Mycetocola spongiae]UCR89272.1 hypothetical protein KXZ72_00725 [Mycetocola spongiae]
MKIVDLPLFAFDDFEQPRAWPHQVPPHFTTAYFQADELRAASAYASELYLATAPYGTPAHAEAWNRKERMWQPSPVDGQYRDANGHQFDLFTAGDGYCPCPSVGFRANPECQCVKPGCVLAQCDTCQWRTFQRGEPAAVAAWHDHAFPGWRDLPVVPPSVKRRDDRMEPHRDLRQWCLDHYPAEWLALPSAPIVTERGGAGTRSVPHMSPWGGFDISHTLRDEVLL